MHRAKELAEAHWGYVKELLKISGVQEQEIKRIGFHYVTSMIHGYKHGYQEATK